MIASADSIADMPGRIVDIHDRIDNGAGVRSGVLDDIGDRIRLGVEKAGDLGLHCHIDWMVFKHVTLPSNSLLGRICAKMRLH